MQFPGEVKSPASARQSARVVYTESALSPGEVSALAALFPTLLFESAGYSWSEQLPHNTEILIAEVDATSVLETEKVVRFLKDRPSRLSVIVAMRHANVVISRAFTRAGAADVIPLPASEASWALAIERLFNRDTGGQESRRQSGQVVAMLKAGGGVGATSLAVQASYLLASRAGGGAKLCFADLDIQFGAGALYFDLSEILTVTDCLAVGDLLGETQFATALGAHKSGIRVLAAPRDVTPLDVLSPPLTDALIGGLRRDFSLTVLDLPPVWTAWTNRALQLADRIVMVTQLSVAHVHLARRQLGILAMQNLDRLPLTLVCNAVTGDQQSALSVKAAERALGREFDVVIPAEERAMVGATNQGLPLSAVRRSSKLDKSIEQLAERMAMDALAPQRMQR
jgi:pilus assembly protein CpaE